MKNTIQMFFAIVLVIAFFCGLAWVGVANNWAIAKVFSPKMEQVRRETFEQSKAYNQGTIQEIQQMQFQYIQAPASEKASLATVILDSTADYDTSKMPPNLQQFVDGLRAERNMSPITNPATATSAPIKEFK